MSPQPDRFDLCILGAGPAGYAAAMRAHDLGKKVLLVEKDRVGGRGIHEGALSSKTMWHLSVDYALACRGDGGFSARDVTLSYRAVMDAVRTAVASRQSLLEYQLDGLSAPTLLGGQVWLERGTGRFVGPHAVEIAGPKGVRLRHADHFLIATGSTPRVPAGVDVDGDLIVTSDHIESWPDFPDSLVIVGAGVVGCEYATVFGNFGRTRQFLIDRQSRILPFEDDDVADCVASSFERMRVGIHRDAQLDDLRVRDGRVHYRIVGPGGPTDHVVDRALISVGRIPNTAGVGLDAAGVQVNPSGGIVVIDDTTRTTAPHIHAAGDTTADVALANVAELEGRHAVEEMFGLNPKPIRYDALSAIMFLDPEVASVGLNEQQARAKGIRYRAAVIANPLVNRNLAMRHTKGFIKLLARPDGQLLGLRVVGPQASSCAQGIAFLIEQRAALEDIDYCVHPHPAVTEGVQECARLLLGRSLYKPGVFGEELLRVIEG